MNVAFGIGMLLIFNLSSFAQTNSLSLGLDYRTYPLDIEDAPMGPSHGDASFYSESFWKPLSFRLSFKKTILKNWSAMLSGVVRYNHTNWKYGINSTQNNNEERPENKSVKYDFVIDLEKEVPCSESLQRGFIIQFGIGAYNLNSEFNVYHRDTLPSGLSDIRHYKGSFSKVGPHLGVGYRVKKLKFVFDCYFVEGPTFQNLTSLWFGTHVVYVIFH